MGQRQAISQINQLAHRAMREREERERIAARQRERITACQIRAGRELVAIGRQTLADMAGIHEQTLGRIEDDQIGERSRRTNRAAVKSALESLGVVFIPPGDGMGAGVRLQYHRNDAS